MIGKIIGHYRILEELGRGGMGVVYKAEDTKLKRHVALKFLPPDMTRDPDAKQRFIHEARAASAIDHSNICTIHEVGETDDGTVFIAMACYDGETLKEKIENGPLPLPLALDYAVQIGEGLQYAHEKGVVHRDIKSANVIVTGRGQVKIMDFGLAKRAGQTVMTKEGTTLGTTAYMSPEQAQGREADARSDIWSLGVILYEMVSGRRPFSGDYEQAVIYAILHEEPEPVTAVRTGVPLELERIIQKAMRKNAGERYQHVEDVIVDLKKLKNESESRVDINPSKDKGKPAKKHAMRKTLIPVAAGCILVIGFFVLRSFFAEAVLGSSPVPIAVISFENQTGDEAYDRLQKVIPNLLITSLEQSSYFRVTTWERMYDLLKQLGKEDVELIDKDLGFDLCSRDGVDAIVLGSITKLGDVFVTDVKVLDVHTKKILKSARSQGRGEASIIKKQIDELTKEISKGVGFSERRMATVQQPVTEMSSESMEAYNYFLSGREERLRYRFHESKGYLEKAVELDSTFSIAYVELAFVDLELGDYQSRRQAFEKAYQYRGKATEKDRLFIEACYAGAIEGNQAKIVGLLEKMTAAYPKDINGLRELGFNYSAIRDDNKALETFIKVLDLDPFDSESWNALGYVYLDMENYEKSRECFERYIALLPGDANPFDSMGEYYFTIGELRKAIENYSKAFELDPHFEGVAYTLSYINALQENYSAANEWIDKGLALNNAPGIQVRGYFLKGFYAYWTGMYVTALDYLDRSALLYQKVGNSFGVGRTEWIQGWIHHDRGEMTLFRKYIDSWSKKLPLYVWNFNLDHATLDIKEGDIDSAKSRLVKLKEYLPVIEKGWKDWGRCQIGLLQAEILLTEGSVKEAIAVSKDVPYSLGFVGFIQDPVKQILDNRIMVMNDVLPRAYHQAGKLDQAIIEYEKLTTFDPNQKGRNLINPKYYYRLARLYDEKGLTEKAVTAYEKFLDLWKDADKDLPQPLDARARLAKLKREG